MNWPVTHETDTWLTRRWAVYVDPITTSLQARPFRSEAERDAWVAANPGMRQAVGKRNATVKSLRAHWKHIASVHGVIGKAP